MESYSAAHTSISRRALAFIMAGVAACGTLGGYAYHEHRVARDLTAQKQQQDVALQATRSQVDDLSAKVNALTAKAEAQPAQPAPAPAVRWKAAQPRHTEPPRWKKMQAQLDAQNQAIEQTRQDLANTQGDLSNTRTELTGSIAHTHDELVLLEKRGERSYYEFDIDKSKQFQHDGPFGMRLKKANVKHQYADLELLVDDRNLSQKHVNLYQPVMFSTPDSPQPAQIVINAISKDHIHGYVSAPRYRQSELASMANTNANNAAGTAQATTNADATTVQRQKLPSPQ